MTTRTASSQDYFYREFLMGRSKINPADYGIEVDQKAFTDQMCEALAQAYPAWSLDELLLHPREAAHFCDAVRRQHGYYDVPDDIILRAIMARRKH